MLPVFGGHTYSWMLHEPVEATLERLAGLGFGAVEMMAHPRHLWASELGAAERATLRRRLERLGFDPVVLNMPNIDINAAATVPEMRAYTLGLLEGAVRLAGDLGAAGVVIGPGKANALLPAPREMLVGHFFAALDRLGAAAHAAGTKIWVENMPFGFVQTAAGVAELLDQYGDPEIGTVFDFTNAYFVGEEFSAGLAAFRDRLKLVHASDTRRDVFRHAVLGSGTMPLEPIPGCLAEVGYRGPIVLEILSQTPDADFVTSRERLLALDWTSRAATGHGP
jgi:L-ribulose-5-phosphate 3-epimerase